MATLRFLGFRQISNLTVKFGVVKTFINLFIKFFVGFWIDVWTTLRWAECSEQCLDEDHLDLFVLEPLVNQVKQIIHVILVLFGKSIHLS